jgi:hypothetical protein
VSAWLLATLLAVAVPAPAPSPQPSPSPTSAAGPCANPALASIAVRPGIGRSPATGGAVCVAPSGTVVVGAGYRAQVTGAAGMRQTLMVYPAPVALVGLPAHTEIIAAPGFAFSRRAGSGAFPLAPANGQQDAGLGIQHLFADRPWTQQAVEFFATSPTGYPDGPNGFSAGAPTYQLSYAIAFALGAAFGLTLSNALLDSSGAAPTARRNGTSRINRRSRSRSRSVRRRRCCSRIRSPAKSDRTRAPETARCSAYSKRSRRIWCSMSIRSGTCCRRPAATSTRRSKAA